LQGAAETAAPFDAFKLTYFDYIVQPSSFWTRKLWYSTGELDTSYRYVLDWEWFIRASKITEFEYVSRFYSVYRYHPLHKTSNGGAERRKEIFDVVKKISSDYWIDLYAEAEKLHIQIKHKKNMLKVFKIPKKDFILPFLVPRIAIKLNKIQDFYSVLTILGS